RQHFVSDETAASRGRRKGRAVTNPQQYPFLSPDLARAAAQRARDYEQAAAGEWARQNAGAGPQPEPRPDTGIQVRVHIPAWLFCRARISVNGTEHYARIGVINVELPAGRHEVVASFSQGVWRRVGKRS